ncbi:hypothetical protein TNCV_3951971 [Trichonephila clavipes]|nr:hypothetical protein TNCV_3951971 [Trichonephila clavipes]
MSPDRQRPDQNPRNSSWQRSLAVALSIIQVTERFSSIHPNFEGEKSGMARGLSPLFAFHKSHARTCGSTAI